MIYLKHPETLKKLKERQYKFKFQAYTQFSLDLSIQPLSSNTMTLMIPM